MLVPLGSCRLGDCFGCSYRTSYNSAVDKELNCLCLASQKGSSLPALACAISVSNQLRRVRVSGALSTEYNTRAFIITQTLESLELPIHQWQGHCQKGDQSKLPQILSRVCPLTVVLLRLTPFEILHSVKPIMVQIPILLAHYTQDVSLSDQSSVVKCELWSHVRLHLNSPFLS